MRNLSLLLDKVKSRTIKGSSSFYKPLPPDESHIVRSHYLSRLDLSPKGDLLTEFMTPNGLLIATGYNRIVIGDYGAYIEFNDLQMNTHLLQPKFNRNPDRHVKYIWLEPNDGSDVKVYHQQDTVAYADYLPGYYYISPSDVVYA